MTPNAGVTVMAANNIGGTQGTVTVACNTTGTVSVALPVGVGVQAIAAITANMSRGSELYNAANTLQVATTVGGTSIPTASIVSGVYKVNAYFNNGVTVLPAGDYAVTVTTTLVAN